MLLRGACVALVMDHARQWVNASIGSGRSVLCVTAQKAPAHRPMPSLPQAALRGVVNTAIVRGRHMVVGHFQVWSLMRHAKNLNYLSLR
jgi:hypothetical protein